MPVDFRHCDSCGAINDAAAERCHKCDHSFVAPIYPAPSTVTPVAPAEPAEPSQSRRVLFSLLALLGLVVLMFFAYQDAPQVVEPVAFAYLEPTATQLDTQQLAIDTESDARLTAYTRAVPVKATATKQSSTRKPATGSKAKPPRSLRAP